MTFEAVVAENLGALTTRDIRGVSLDVSKIYAIVLALQGVPFVGHVALGEMAAGPGRHRGLICAACSMARYRLFPVDDALLCGGCSRRRSRQQSDKSLRTWQRLGGKEEDLLLRALRRGRTSSSLPPGAAEAAQALSEADRCRWTTLRGHVAAALMTAVAGDVGVDDIEDPDDTYTTEENEHEPS